ncbi:MAG: sigma factor-like helix-turn-helix DNA-binding protein [Candidatus Caccovivens sp.]
MLWAKTMIVAYNRLPEVCESIDKIIYKYALRRTWFDTYDMLQKIIEQSERKKNLINLKIVIENALDNLNEIDREIIQLRYVNCVNVKDISQKLNISPRTTFRHLNSSILNFWNKMCELGYRESDMEEMFRGEKWILSLKEQLSLCNEEDNEKPKEKK